MGQNSLLIGTDFSEASVWAALHAAEFAEKLKYRIDLVHILDAGESESLVQEHLEDIAKRLRETHGVEVGCETYSGDPGRTLARLSLDPKYAMVAVGYSGRSGILSRIGSTVAKTVRLVDKPILVLVPSHHITGPVIGCVDFSEGTERINFWTHYMACIRENKPAFVHVAAPYMNVVAAAGPTTDMLLSEAVMNRLGGSESEYLARLESTVRERLAIKGDESVEILMSLSVASAISDYAEKEDASLVVLGRHGHNTLTSRIIGTTAEHIMSHSECSTLILP